MFNKARVEELRRAFRASGIRAAKSEPTEEDLYTMSMEDLRRFGSTHQRALMEEMRQVAEEGGW